MIISLMSYFIIASGLLGMAAIGVEAAFGAAGWPRRYVWMGGMAAIVAMAGVAPLRFDTEPTPRPLVVSEAVEIGGLRVAETSPGAWSSLTRIREAARRGVQKPISTAAELVEPGAGQLLGGIWLVSSFGLLSLGAATVLRYRRVRRAWPVREIEGVQVRISPALGPAVLGIVHPEIVIPDWLLSSPAEERRLAILHEREHLRARDSLSLDLGCAAAALAPWNPILWWMLLRLRIAIEVDCDARVLKKGVGRAAYGSMLIDVSGHGSGLSLGVPALAGFPSTLERRLVAMTMKLGPGSAVRGGILGMVGVAALLAACEARLPTASEIDALDVAEVETQAQQLGLFETLSDSIVYVVDGEVVSAEEARAIATESIARVEVQRRRAADGPESGTIRIETRSVPGMEASARVREIDIVRDSSRGLVAVSADSAEIEIRSAPGAKASASIRAIDIVRDTTGALFVVAADSAGGEHSTPVRIERRVIRSVDADTYISMGIAPEGVQIPFETVGDPLLIIDGDIADKAAFEGLDPDEIESISVLKRPSQSVYDDPRAENGVILITTRQGATGP